MNKRFGVMIDCSRNAVMTKQSLFSFIDYVKSFGYNSIMLYTEDTYEVNNEPYFGYLRGRYSKQELKEIDAYCVKNGIELIPCIQTLAHLNSIFKWQEYSSINDIDDVLLVDEERTYLLIENVFNTIAECFSSRTVHIGMDEARHVGLGRYLQKNGYSNRFDVLYNHLNKVVEIGKRHGFECLMWSDMFFRLANNGDYYVKPNGKMKPDVKDKIPDALGLVYWDYYHIQKTDYDAMIDAHDCLTAKSLWFAGGAWSWLGFAPSNRFALKSMAPAMQSCREKNVDNIFITVWGDDGGECSRFSVLPSLFYIKRIYDGQNDEQRIKQDFYSIVGETFDDMMLLDLPNIPCDESCAHFVSPAKYSLFADLFLGFVDTQLAENGNEYYKKCAKILYKKRNGKFSRLFETAYRLCDVLADKYRLGVKIRSAYKDKNKKLLREYISIVDVIIKKLNLFYSALRNQWFSENKPNGFDVQDMRFGGLERRLLSCKQRLIDYVNGKIDCICELEEPLLDTKENDDGTYYNSFRENCTVNIL